MSLLRTKERTERDLKEIENCPQCNKPGLLYEEFYHGNSAIVRYYRVKHLKKHGLKHYKCYIGKELPESLSKLIGKK